MIRLLVTSSEYFRISVSVGCASHVSLHVVPFHFLPLSGFSKLTTLLAVSVSGDDSLIEPLSYTISSHLELCLSSTTSCASSPDNDVSISTACFNPSNPTDVNLNFQQSSRKLCDILSTKVQYLFHRSICPRTLPTNSGGRAKCHQLLFSYGTPKLNTVSRTLYGL